MKTDHPAHLIGLSVVTALAVVLAAVFFLIAVVLTAVFALIAVLIIFLIAHIKITPFGNILSAGVVIILI